MEQSESRLLVRDVMTPQVEVIDPREKLSEAARTKRNANMRRLLSARFLRPCTS